MNQKLFFKNVIPSMLAFAFSGIYAIVDGWFIGRNIGDAGLAGINIAYPITALIQAAGTGIGMSGAIQIAISRGKGDEERQKTYLGNTLTLLAVACVLLTGVLIFTYPYILRAFGAEGDIYQMSVDYIKIIILGSVFEILGTGLLPLIRNYDGAITAMSAMVAGFVSNVALDWLFVVYFPFGMTGAAVATIIGQGMTILPCVIFLWRKKKLAGYARFKPHAAVVKDILVVGISPFGLTLSPNIIIVIINKGAILLGGASAAACYAVVSYIVCVTQLFLQGVGDGCQPLISLYHGLEDLKAVKQVRKMAYIFALSVSAFCMAGIYFLREPLARFFGVSASVAGEVAKVLPIFITGFLFIGILRVTTAYFYAVKRNRFAYLLIYGEPVCLTILMAAVMTPAFGLSGVWTAVPVTQGILTIVALLLLWKEKKEHDTWFLEESEE